MPLKSALAETYVYWCRKHILLHEKRHPSELRAAGFEAFLKSLTALHLLASSHVRLLTPWVCGRSKCSSNSSCT